MKHYVCAPFLNRPFARRLFQCVGPRSSHQLGKSTSTMLHYAIVFLIISLIAAFLGFGSLAGTAALIAKVCFVIFLVFAIVSFLKRG